MIIRGISRGARHDDNERLFRIGIASDLFAFAGIVALTGALYVLLRPVNEDLVPGALAAWGVFSSLLVLTSAFWAIVFPGSARTPLLASYVALFTYEVTLGFWLLLKGARIQRVRPVRPGGPGPRMEATK